MNLIEIPVKLDEISPKKNIGCEGNLSQFLKFVFLGSQFKEFKESHQEAWSWRVQVSHMFCGKIFAQKFTLYVQVILCKIFSHPNKE